MASSIIELQRITRLYQVGGVELWALDAVTLTVGRAEFVAIMGA